MPEALSHGLSMNMCHEIMVVTSSDEGDGSLTSWSLRRFVWKRQVRTTAVAGFIVSALRTIWSFSVPPPLSLRLSR